MSNDRNYWQRTTGRHVSRRAALRGAGLGLVGIAGASLIGCGDGDGDGGSDGGGSDAGGGSGATGDIKRGGTFISNPRVGDPPTIDPYGNLSFETKRIAVAVYSRLFKRDTWPGSDGGETTPDHPDVAASVETADGLEWIVKLNPAAKFHNVAPVNGRRVTSQDVLFSWQRLTAPETVGSDRVKGVGNVSTPDDDTIIFNTDAPSPTFQETLADGTLLFIMPTESDGGFDPAVDMIGSGPWILKNYEPSVQFELDAHPEWHEAGEDGNPLPYAAATRIPIIPEYSNRLAQLEAGNIDMLDAVNGDDVLDVKARHEDLQWLGSVSTVQSMFYFSNTLTTDQPWGDERVRQAISRALDRNSLSELGYNEAALAGAGLSVKGGWQNIIPVGFGERWWLDPQSAAAQPSHQHFVYDLAEAKKLLAAAGYEDGFKMPYIYTGRYTGAFPPIAEAHINMLQQLGIDVVTEVQDYSSKYITQTFVGNFEGSAFGYETPFPEPGSYFSRMFGDNETNKGRVTDSEIDEIARKQAVELDYEARKELLHDLQRVNAKHMYYVPSQAGAGTSWRAYASRVQGGIRDTSGYGDNAEIYPYYSLSDA